MILKICFRKLFLLTFLSVCVSAFSVQAQLLNKTYSDNTCEMDTAAFPINEKLIYKAFYNAGFLWIGVGETHFTVEETELNGKSVFRSFANAFNYKKTAWIYEVKDTYQTYLDKYTLHPVRFQRAVHEGGYSMDYQYDFDYENQTVFIDHMIRQNKLRRSKETVGISACTYDVMSAYHYARNLDYSNLEVNETIPFDLFLDGETYPIQVKYLGKETIKTKMGKVRCIKFSPELIEGDVFADGDELLVYVSDDKNKIPIYMESQLSIGKVKVYLDEYENLRFPFASKK